MFTNSLAGGGAERAVATLANYWAGRRWGVMVATLAPVADDFYRLDPRVERIAFDLGRPSTGVFDALCQNARRVGALRRVLAEARPDVALSMMSTPNVLLAFASRGMPGLLAVGAERCYPPYAPLGRVWSSLRRRMYGRLSALVAQTADGAQWLGANSSARRIAVIPNAAPWPLPVQAPTIAPALHCGVGRRILLAVGRLDGVKNFSLLVQVFARLAARHAGWDLVILGEGIERAALERAVRDNGLAQRVRLPGMAGNVGQWYGRAELFVMSSRSEGFPNALAEALAHGLPAVSFDCRTGPRDIIRHGVDGLLAAPDDADALADALDRVMGDSRLRARLAARAGAARQRFSLDRVAGMWEALFSELTDAQATGAGFAPAGQGGRP